MPVAESPPDNACTLQCSGAQGKLTTLQDDGTVQGPLMPSPVRHLCGSWISTVTRILQVLKPQVSTAS